MRRFKRISFVLAVIFFLGLATVPVHAVDVDLALDVEGGTLSVDTGSVTLPSVEIDLSRNQVLSGSVLVTVVDNRGTGYGWDVTLQATDWVAEVSDPTSSGTMEVKFPPSFSSVGGEVLSSSISSANIQLSNITLGTSPQTVISAPAGYGMGTHIVGLDLDITVPNTVQVSSVGTGSSYVEGQVIGVLSGTYNSTWTFTVSSGI